MHLASTVLSAYIINSLVLALGVGLGATLLGTYLAYCVVHYDFAGKKVLQALILLPLAMPAYIIAYTYTGLLDFAGPLQSYIRESFELSGQQYYFPEVRSLGGAIVMMSLVLYPYVYILARTAFSEQSQKFKEVSELAGISAFEHFIKVSLPLARPAILTGAALAMMEALADFGTVEYFGVSTFTTGIYRTWFGMGDINAASQLSGLLCLFVFVLLILEKSSRKSAQSYSSRQGQGSMAKSLSMPKGILVLLLCSLPLIFGFVIPFTQLGIWAWSFSDASSFSDYASNAFNSATVALIGTVLIVLLALLFSYAKRLQPTKANRFVVQFVSLGYAMPGTVIAIGVLVPLGWLDIKLNLFTSTFFGFQPGLVLSGTIAALIFAYIVRFMSVALHNTEAGIQRIKPSMDEASRALGDSKLQTLTRVHLPLLSASLLSACLLVFVDILKELPATLVLRPFNFNTLAVKAFELASDERLIEAALPSITIVLVGILPVILLTATLNKIEKSHA
ncbi:iron ABC transporter permease [Glaciecola sp. MH2013]|uniref:ABC transporter permease n=1 Tax=Glaciecola sp. MH2013 TaxID=2785524 RepID=UPI001E518ACE|nr:iron ABC transporter permease [Glaciecola sp. MH2013]